MRKSVSGFTIAELLIVVVVIAILAAISTVAFAGIQQRAQNAKVAASIRDWAQIISSYKAEMGDFPASPFCLGDDYGRGFTNSEPTGGHCRQDNPTGGMININPTIVNRLKPYADTLPSSPSFLVAGVDSYPWYKGAYFYPWYSGSKARIDYIISGSSTPCPSIYGLEQGGTYVSAATNTVRCTARFPDSPS